MKKFSIFNFAILIVLLLTERNSLQDLIEDHGGTSGVIDQEIINNILETVSKIDQLQTPLLKSMLELDTDKRIGYEELLQKARGYDFSECYLLRR